MYAQYAICLKKSTVSLYTRIVFELHLTLFVLPFLQGVFIFIFHVLRSEKVTTMKGDPYSIWNNSNLWHKSIVSSSGKKFQILVHEWLSVVL